MDSRMTLGRIFGFVALAGVLAVTSCQPAPATQAPVPTTVPPAQQPAATKPPAATQPAALTPRKGGTIVASIAVDPMTLNIARSSDSNVITVASKLFNTLVVNDASYQPQVGPGLASSVTMSADGLTYTFVLRSGVKWQDGEAFTCNDVAFTFGEFMPKYNTTSAVMYQNIDNIKCKDDLTAIFTLKQPSQPLLTAMGQMDGGAVMPKHLLSGTDPAASPFNQKPVGTGPFMLQEWVRGDHITLVRNPNYFLKGRPFLDKIYFKIVPDAAAVTPAFDAKEVDYIQDFRSSKSDLERLSKDPNIQIGYDLEPPKKMVLEFNVISCKLCMDVNVRRAISAAINREEAIKLTRFGLGTPMYNPVSPAYKWAFNKDAQEPKFDLAYANKLLDDAGYKRGADGNRFSLTLTTTAGDVRYVKPAEVIREQLKAIGIDLKLNFLERTVMYDQVAAKYNFDVFMVRHPGGGDPATGVWTYAMCAYIDPKKTNVNYGRYCNQKLDDLVRQGEMATTQAARAKAYFEAQKILTDEIPIIDLWTDTTTDITTKDFAGHFLQGWPGDSNWDYVWWTKGAAMAEGSYDPVYWLTKK